MSPAQRKLEVATHPGTSQRSAGDAYIAQGRTTGREAYAVAGGAGGSVLEGRDRPARNEIIAISDEVEEMCHDDLPTQA